MQAQFLLHSLSIRVDEVVKTENVQMKVVVLEMTYKNNGDIDLTDSRDDSFALIVCPETQHFPNNVVDWFKNSDPDSPSAYPSMPINNNSTFSLEADNTTSKYSIEIPCSDTNAEITEIIWQMTITSLLNLSNDKKLLY